MKFFFCDTKRRDHFVDLTRQVYNLSSVYPTSTPSRIIIGNGVGLPISHVGSAPFRGYPEADI